MHRRRRVEHGTRVECCCHSRRFMVGRRRRAESRHCRRHRSRRRRRTNRARTTAARQSRVGHHRRRARRGVRRAHRRTTCVVEREPCATPANAHHGATGGVDCRRAADVVVGLIEHVRFRPRRACRHRRLVGHRAGWFPHHAAHRAGARRRSRCASPRERTITLPCPTSPAAPSPCSTPPRVS